MIRSTKCAGVRTSVPTRVRATLALSLLLSLAACSRDSGPTGPVPVALVEIAPVTAPSMFLGQRQTLSVSVMDGQRQTLSDRHVAWSNSNPTAVQLELTSATSLSAVVTALGVGSSEITASVEGKSSAVTVIVHPPGAVATVEVPSALTMTVPSTSQLSVVLKDADGVVLTGRVITYASSNPAVATVSDAGLVTSVAAGPATVTITSEGKSGSTKVIALAPSRVATVEVPWALTVSLPWTYKLWVVLRDADGVVLTGRVITYASSDPAIATVSSEGLLTPVAAGLTTVTVTSEGKSGSTQVTVPPPAHAFLWTAANGMQDLGVLSGFVVSNATAVNASGTVVGTMWNRAGPHGFRWTSGFGMVDLGVFPGGTYSSASAVNSSGVVVGQSGTQKTPHAALWSASGAIQDLGTLPGDDVSSATAIDDAGRVVGVSLSTTREYITRAFIWTPADGMKLLPMPAGRDYYSSANGMNKSGDVVGEGTFRPFRWNVALEARELPLLTGDNYGSAVAINDLGTVVGISADQGVMCDADCFYVPHVVLWPAEGEIIDLTAATGQGASVAAINASGQVVGTTSLGRGFLWSAAGGLRDLGVLPGRGHSTALGINDAGQVVGSSY